MSKFFKVLLFVLVAALFLTCDASKSKHKHKPASKSHHSPSRKSSESSHKSKSKSHYKYHDPGNSDRSDDDRSDDDDYVPSYKSHSHSHSKSKHHAPKAPKAPKSPRPPKSAPKSPKPPKSAPYVQPPSPTPPKSAPYVQPPPLVTRPPPKSSSPPPTGNVFNVLNYGAVGDGVHDDAEAFIAAYEAACDGGENPTLWIPYKPAGYRLSPIEFGECTGLTMKVDATLVAVPRSIWIASSHGAKAWLDFSKVSKFNLVGGTFNGNGQDWWAHSCKRDRTQRCGDAPTAVRFTNSNNIKVDGITVTNSPQIHLTFDKSDTVVATNVVINSPETSPNTDGIHVSGTTNMEITGADLSAGDDCVSIVSGSSNIRVFNSRCGPGHGISIGSLGKGGSFATVTDVHVSGVKIQGTMYGVRIKTWQGGQGYVRNVRFENVVMNNVKNPIIVDQNYCNGGHNCQAFGTSLAIDGITYSNISGTSATPAGITLQCNAKTKCTNIHFENVALTLAKSGSQAASVCNHVAGYSQQCSPIV